MPRGERVVACQGIADMAGPAAYTVVAGLKLAGEGRQEGQERPGHGRAVMPHFSRLSVSRKNNQRRPAEVSRGGKRDAGEGTSGWVHQTAGKIMEPSKAIISVGPLAE